MGAAGLVEIKRRLKSIKNTMKITRAMGLVSTSKLRKCRKELTGSSEYASGVKDTFKQLASVIEDGVDVPYFKKNSSDKILYIIITSDSGLCAGYNGNAVAYLKNKISDDPENSLVIDVGAKGISFLKRARISTVAEYVDISDIPSAKEVRTIYEKALEMFLEEEVYSVKVVYTKFISPIKQEIKCETLLPLEEEAEESDSIEVEPDFKSVLATSLNLYLNGRLREIMLSAKCSEQSARMTAMNGATQNAGDIISALNLKYNRIRQTAITQELSEIIGGANIKS